MWSVVEKSLSTENRLLNSKFQFGPTFSYGYGTDSIRSTRSFSRMLLMITFFLHNKFISLKKKERKMQHSKLVNRYISRMECPRFRAIHDWNQGSDSRLDYSLVFPRRKKTVILSLDYAGKNYRQITAQVYSHKEYFPRKDFVIIEPKSWYSLLIS